MTDFPGFLGKDMEGDTGVYLLKGHDRLGRRCVRSKVFNHYPKTHDFVPFWQFDSALWFVDLCKKELEAPDAQI